MQDTAQALNGILSQYLKKIGNNNVEKKIKLCFMDCKQQDLYVDG